MTKLKIYIALFLLSICSYQIRAFQITNDQTLAFPGAEGFGKYTTGGRGGRVCIVTNLNDRGEGSLREAILLKEPRVIVFAVSGTISLESQLDINSGNVTIAGQSAPGDGICLRNYPTRINANNVVIRYMRFRMGDTNKVQNDAIYGLRHKDIMIDHCSMSWSTDECASFYDNENFTLQWCIISESLNASVHEKGEHGYGGIWGGKGASFHHNLLAHHNSRNPRFCGARYHKQPDKEIVDFRNNVIYNWGINSSYAGERGNHNIVNNYYKPGPATPKSKAARILNPWSPFGKFYVSGNIVDGNAEVSNNNWDGIQGEHVDSAYAAIPISVVDLPVESATMSYGSVLQKAGASIKRDVIDQRIIDETSNGTAHYGNEKSGIIDSQQDVGGWPVLISLQPLKDSDNDGMPDIWEKIHNTNKSKDDSSRFDVSKTYSNIEVYLNSLVE